MKKENFIQQILRANPDIIYSSTLHRAAQTAERIKDIILEYASKEVHIIGEDELAKE